MNERTDSVFRTYGGIRPAIFELKAAMGHIDTLVDLGCGDGIMSTVLAHDLGPKRVILVDEEEKIKIPLTEQVRFQKLNVCDVEFVSTLKDEVQLMTCFTAFHEFEDPLTAIHNMAAILPQGGTIFLLDRSEEGWHAEEKLVESLNSDSQTEHYFEDLRKLDLTGLGTDKGIRTFWEDRIRPKLNGPLLYENRGDSYFVMYQALH